MGHSTRVALFALSLLVSAIVSLAVGMLGRAALLRVWLGWWPGWRGFEDGVFLAVIGLFFASPFLLIIATRVRERPGGVIRLVGHYAASAGVGVMSSVLLLFVYGFPRSWSIDVTEIAIQFGVAGGIWPLVHRVVARFVPVDSPPPRT